MLEDGARLTPGSRFEVFGAIQFAATEEAPVFDCEVEASSWALDQGGRAKRHLER